MGLIRLPGPSRAKRVFLSAEQIGRWREHLWSEAEAIPTLQNHAAQMGTKCEKSDNYFIWN